MKKLNKHERSIGRELKQSMPVEKLEVLFGWTYKVSEYNWDDDEFEAYEREWEWECECYYDDADWYYPPTAHFLSFEEGMDCEAAKEAWLAGAA